MGIFGSIMKKLGFGDDEPQAEQVEAAPEAVENLTETSTPEVTTGGDAAAVVVDVVAHLDDLASKSSEDLDWKASIVDMMKLLGIDSSYAHRKELAAEVGIEGYKGSEDQNIALHKAVLAKLAANGGNIPSDLLD